jgi:hypothetical protein
MDDVFDDGRHSAPPTTFNVPSLGVSEPGVVGIAYLPSFVVVFSCPSSQ